MPHLVDDMCLLLVKKYILKEEDSFSFAISGVNKSFSDWYMNKYCYRSLLRGHYSIDSPYLWRRYFHQQIFPSPITVLDVSHLYWLNTGVLNNCICDLPNLEELCVQDTKISLANFPRVFEACQKIVKLSLTFVESDLESCEEQVLGKKALEGIKKGFRRLTHLKMFVFFLDDQGCAESWLNILGVLKWCRNCYDLLLNVTYSGDIESSTPYFSDEMIRKAFSKMLSSLGWMKQLKSLIILQDGRVSTDDISVHEEIMGWILKEVQEGSLKGKLERLWICVKNLWHDDCPVTCSSVKSCVVDSKRYTKPTSQEYPIWLDDERYQHLEYLAEVPLGSLKFCDLKYIRSYFPSSYEGLARLREFCRSHLKLEQLLVYATSEYFSPHPPLDEDEVEELFRDWKLPMLKDLVYHSDGSAQLPKSLMKKFAETFPNINKLAIRDGTISMVDFLDFYTSIRFEYLTSLIIEMELFNATYLLSIFNNCPKLERLNLDTWHVNEEWDCQNFFRHLSLSLSAANNLRDLRLTCAVLPKDISCLVPFFKALLTCSSHLERLFFHVHGNNALNPWQGTECTELDELDGINGNDELDGINGNDEMGGNDELDSMQGIQCNELENFLVEFVKEMTHLVALCLVGIQFRPDTAAQLTIEILPLRPPFWFSLGPELPKMNDQSVPKIHGDEIVFDYNPYCAPPHFS